MQEFWMFTLKALLFLVSAFLILLVLVQRGRGGGLAGALGGMGGQSAFGTKAGDLFTRVTIVVAAIWIILCAFAVKTFRPDDPKQFTDQSGGVKATAPADTNVVAPTTVPPPTTPPAPVEGS